MITVSAAIILGVVEGLTEFLPVSSTAHLNLTANLLNLSQSNFLKTFEIAIQSGAIFAVLLLYRKRFLEKETLQKMIVAFIPTGVLGLAFYQLVKVFLVGNTTVALWALALGGLGLMVFDKFHREDSAGGSERIDYTKALAIGLFQSLALIPGVSRSAATIVGGLILGIKREVIVEFSFLLAVPTMLVATGFDLLKNLNTFSYSDTGLLLVGFLVSLVTALISIKTLLTYIKNHTFTAFGLYRIVLVLIYRWLGPR